jgi:hypothetical protein
LKFAAGRVRTYTRRVSTVGPEGPPNLKEGRKRKEKENRLPGTVEEVPTVRVQQGPTVRTGTVGAKNTLR